MALSAGLCAAALGSGAASAAVPAALLQTTVRAGALCVAGKMVAGTVSAQVMALTEGVLQAMFWQKVKIAAAVVLTVGLLGGAGLFAGRGVAARPPEAAAPALQANAVDDKPADRKPEDKDAKDDPKALAAAMAASRNNLQVIAIAMHNYHDANGTLPGPALLGKDGKPLLSWRVLLLPYLEEDNLYKQFKLDEPWDSEHNKKLLAKMPKVYRTPGAGKDATLYQAFVGKGTAFEGPKGLRLPADFPDGTSNTILVIEAGKAVPWTKPEDLAYAPTGQLPPLGGAFKQVINAVFVDGAAYALKRKFNEKTLRVAITRNDGVPYDKDDLLEPAPGITDPAELKQANAKLRVALRQMQADVQQLRGQLIQLRIARERKPKEDAEREQLKREYQVLQQELNQAADEAARLREQIELLKKTTKPPEKK